MAQPLLGPFSEWDIFPLHEEKERPKSSGTPTDPLVVHTLRLYHKGKNGLIGLDTLSDEQGYRHSSSNLDPTLPSTQREQQQEYEKTTTFVTTPRSSSIQTTPARKSPSRSSNKLTHRHLLDDDDENPNVVSQGHAAATNSNVDLTVRQEGESRDVVVFWRGVIHFNIPLSRVKRTNNKQAYNDYDDEGEETGNNNTQQEGGSPGSNQDHDYYDHDGPLSRLTPHGVDLVRAHAQSRGVSISNGFSLLVQGNVSHYEFVWGTPQTLGTSGPSTKSGKSGTSRGDASTFPSVNATDRASASRGGGVQNTTASSSSPRVKRRQNESGVLHTTNKNNLLLYSVVPCSHGCTRTYLVESFDEFAQLDSRETQRHDALIAWMRAMKQRAPNSTWAKEHSWYVNRYMEDFPHMVKVGEQSDRRGPENKRCHIRSALTKAITDPKYRKMIMEERLIRKKEVDDVLREQQQMKRQGFALQQLLSSLDATTDDRSLPPRNPSILHSIIGGSQPDSERNHWMEDSAAVSSNYTRHATAVDVEETKAGVLDSGQEIESHNDNSPFNIKRFDNLLRQIPLGFFDMPDYPSVSGTPWKCPHPQCDIKILGEERRQEDGRMDVDDNNGVNSSSTGDNLERTIRVGDETGVSDQVLLAYREVIANHILTCHLQLDNGTSELTNEDLRALLRCS